MLGRRTLGAGLTAMVLVLVTACGGVASTSPGDEATGAGPTVAPTTTENQTAAEASPPPATGPAVESAPPAQEETDGPEQPVAGGQTGVSIQIPGLPVGTGGTVDLGDSWCGVFFWRESLPAGVELQITSAVAETEGARVLEQPCEEAPPCPGTVISAERQQGCGITVVPPSPAVDLVLVRLDGVVHCEDLPTCQQVLVGSGVPARLENPYGGPAPGGDGEESGTTDEDSGTTGSDTDGATAGPEGG